MLNNWSKTMPFEVFPIRPSVIKREHGSRILDAAAEAITGIYEQVEEREGVVVGQHTLDLVFPSGSPSFTTSARKPAEAVLFLVARFPEAEAWANPS
jgi:hypothetical protein